MGLSIHIRVNFSYPTNVTFGLSTTSALARVNTMSNPAFGKKVEQPDIQRILRKRTLTLGEVHSSSEEEQETEKETVSAKLARIDRLYPGWWQEDQHVVECACGFCQLMFDRKPLDSSGAAAVCSGAAAGQTADEVASSEPIADEGEGQCEPSAA